ncbi:Nn.00g030070.m01.CDS01 [Neocucurbitaria sp. VM-36]
MRTSLVALVFAVSISASPYPWAEPQASLVPTVSDTPGGHHNGSGKGNRTHKNPHKEPTPTFKLACDCARPIVPMNLLSENEKCLMNHAAAMGCYLGSKGGCPSPTPACGLGIL